MTDFAEVRESDARLLEVSRRNARQPLAESAISMHLRVNMISAWSTADGVTPYGVAPTSQAKGECGGSYHSIGVVAAACMKNAAQLK